MSQFDHLVLIFLFCFIIGISFIIVQLSVIANLLKEKK